MKEEKHEVLIEGTYCVYSMIVQPVLIGSGIIVPKNHRETVFDLTPEELEETFKILKEVRERVDELYKPQGYNVGWNCYPVGGQFIPHAHLHVIPRFDDEPLAGKGIRHHLKQESNKRYENTGQAITRMSGQRSTIPFSHFRIWDSFDSGRNCKTL